MNPNIANSTNSIIDEPTILMYGIVEATNDNLKLNRVKVRVFGVHNDDKKQLPTGDLPWAIVVNPTSNPSNKTGVGTHKLVAGTMVVGFFADGADCQQFVVMGSIYSKINTSGIIPIFSLEDIQNPGAVFISRDNNTKSNKIPFAKNTNIINAGNPLGRVDNVPLADGKNGGGTSMFNEIKTQITSLGNIFKYIEIYDVDNIVLGEDIDRELGFIPLSILGGLSYNPINVDSIPPRGIVQIDQEIISYSEVNENGLVGIIMRGSPDITSSVPTAKSSHTKGTPIKWLYPIIKNDRAPLVYSKITRQAIDFAKEVRRVTKIIRGYITWFVNQVASFASGMISDAIAKVSLFLKSPTPLLVKTICDALLVVASQIICSLGKSTVDSIVFNIENMIVDKINELLQQFYTGAKALDNFIESCSSKIFDGIMQLTSIVQSVGNLVTDITNKIPGISGKANSLSDGVQSSISGSGGFSLPDIASAGSTIATLLNFLGIGCKNVVGSNNDSIGNAGSYTSCTNYMNILDCSSANPDLIGTLNTWFRPLEGFLDEQDYGGGIVEQRDSSPGAERTLIQGPAGTSVEVFNDGTRKTVITNNNYKIVLGGDYIQIQGDVAIKIDGNMSTKVSGNYDLEIGGELRTSVGGASQITYGGSHKLNLLGDSSINATNKLDLAGSKIGIAGSNGVDIAGGTLSALVSEINLTSIGSLNLVSLYRNDITGFSVNEVCSGVKTTLCVGAETNVNSSSRISTIFGANTINNMSTLNFNTAGAATYNFASLWNVSSNIKTESVAGIAQFSANSIVENSQMKTSSVSGLNLSSATTHIRTSSAYSIDN